MPSYMQSIHHFSCCLIITLWANANAGTGLCVRLFRVGSPRRDGSSKRIAQPHGMRIFRQTWHERVPHEPVGKRCAITMLTEGAASKILL